jgi:regulator of protease activity HflC (stomatin/prohibitin superfamily)
VSAQPDATPQRWTLSGWMRRNWRIAGFIRLLITLAALGALAIAGELLLSNEPAPTVFDPANSCTYAAAEYSPSPYGLTAEAGKSFPITWRIQNIGSCTVWGTGIALARKSDQIPSDQNLYPIDITPQDQLAQERQAGSNLQVLIIVTQMTAPPAPGLYETSWQMQDANGQPFGPLLTRRVQVYAPGLAPAQPPPNQPSLIETLFARSLSGILYAVPALLAIILVLWRGNDFLMEMFVLRSPASARDHVISLMYGLGSAYLNVYRGKLDHDPDNAAAEVIGGPGWLMVGEKSAALLERGARFTRIVGPGGHRLAPHERVRGTADLQIQTRHQREKTLTKDGIPIDVDVDLTFRLSEKDIDGDSQTEPPPTPLGPIMRLRRLLGLHVPASLLEAARPHRFSREAVRRVVYESSVFGPDQQVEWTASFATVRAGDISDQLAELRLDELSSPEDPDMHPLVEIVQKGLQDARRAAAAINGIDVLNMTMGLIEAPSDIKHTLDDQRIDNWQIEWRRRARLLEAEGQAKAFQVLEEARAEAQANMIQALTEGFRIATENNPDASTEVIAMRFIDALEALMQTGVDKHEEADHQADSGKEESGSRDKPDDIVKPMAFSRRRNS